MQGKYQLDKYLSALLAFLLTVTMAVAAPRHHVNKPDSPVVTAQPMTAAKADASAPVFDAHYAYMVDFDTGRVLYNKNGEERMPTSSMSKMMTMYLVFEQLKQGKLALDSKLPVSEHAWKTGGAGTESSTMFLKLNDNVAVQDLIRGVIIQSGNDATIVLAEGIAGSEDAFAERMNLKAQELGMTESHFMNASGLPDPNHYSSPRDLSILAKRLIEDFPEYYHFFSELKFTWNGITQMNRNPLLYRNIGVDGLKTGHAEEAGYGLTASGVENGHRLILVMNGMPSMQARADEPATLLEWGYHEFRLMTLFKAGDVLDQAPVWLGAADTVPVAVDRDVKMTLTADERHNLKATIVYDRAAQAPIAVGDKVGIVRIEVPGNPAVEVPLVATQAVEKLGPFPRMIAALKMLISGHT
jgi:D-alanyl-D-alanine carboxypeptidase (penicillin-binding protein 5/6)